MSDENETNSEVVRDPQGLLKAYNKAVSDLQGLRKEFETYRETFSEDSIARWKDRAIKEAVKDALQREGIKDADRIMKYMKLDDVDFTEDDSLTGLDDKLTEVKTDFPELFDVKRRAGSSSADIHANNPAKKELSPSEMQVAAIYG